MASGGGENGLNGVSTEDVTADESASNMQPDAEEEKAAQEFKETCARELKEKLDALGTGFKHNVEDRFFNLEQRYGEHKEINKVKQTDVLRLNKITRDVSRALGDDWKDVFKFVMSGCEEGVIEKEMVLIEKERPFMQAYKALMRWRELKGGEGVDVEKLIDALQVCDKATLADHVKAVLYSEGEELLQIGKVGAGMASQSTSKSRPSNSASNSTDQSNSTTTTTNTQHSHEALDDRKLLQLAKKIGPCWFDLASLLGVSDEDVTEVKSSEGATYQGAFKIIWMWRDRTLDSDTDQHQVLREALKAANMADVAQLV